MLRGGGVVGWGGGYKRWMHVPVLLARYYNKNRKNERRRSNLLTWTDNRNLGGGEKRRAGLIYHKLHPALHHACESVTKNKLLTTDRKIENKQTHTHKNPPKTKQNLEDEMKWKGRGRLQERKRQILVEYCRLQVRFLGQIF